jgi:hypothetical protein
VRDLPGHSKVDTPSIDVNTTPLEEERGAVDALAERSRVIEYGEKFHRDFTANERWSVFRTDERCLHNFNKHL